MMQIPFAEIVKRIQQHSDLSAEKIEQMVEEKMEKLAGLISREGAAHIIANELGIALFKTGKLQIGHVLTDMRNVEVDGRIMQVFPLTAFTRKDGTPGKVASCIIGDETGTIRIAAWGGHADCIAPLSQGTIIRVKGGYVRENNGRKEIHLNERSECVVNPEGVTIGEVPTTEGVRKPINELQETDNQVTILGTVVQVLEPKYYDICPQCGSRVQMRGLERICEKHGVVQPD